MLDVDINLKILESEALQKDIIKETIEVAKQNSFQGVVLDLEMSSVLLFSDMTNDITHFVEIFSQEAKKNNLKFAMTIYGDTFYRKRSYDVKELAKHVDELLIMTYDFSKSYGEPGPNFPYQDDGTYGYDFQTMINDFSHIVSKDKLTVIFGMFGYEWVVNPDGKPLKRATSLSLNQIQQKFFPNCNLKNCKVTTNNGLENQITFIDEDGKTHIIWYESERSVERKIEFLKEKGIGSIGYWAYGYY
jgi:spore germination protein